MKSKVKSEFVLGDIVVYEAPRCVCVRRYSEGVALCELLLEFCPESCVLRDAVADLHLHSGSGDRAVSMWLHALAECPHNAEVFYHCCKFLMVQVSSTVSL